MIPTSGSRNFREVVSVRGVDRAAARLFTALALWLGLLFAAAPPAVAGAGAGTGAGGAVPWGSQPVNFTYEPWPGCPYRGPRTIYRVCENQMALFGAARQKAEKEGKLLIVVVGAPWCSWCKVLHTALPGPDMLGYKRDALDYGATFGVVEIASSAVHAGKRVRVSSGDWVTDWLLDSTPGVQIRTIPFLMVVDPTDQRRVYARNLDDAQKQGEVAMRPERIRGLLAEAHAYLRHGVAPKGEPGWLARKLDRVLGR
jgi:hypothetical protein